MSAMIVVMENVRAGRALASRVADVESIAERLRLARVAMGFSTNGLADAAGVAPNVISNYETSLRRPSLDQVVLLLPVLNVTLDWIYLGDDRGLTVETRERLRAAEGHMPPRRRRNARSEVA